MLTRTEIVEFLETRFGLNVEGLEDDEPLFSSGLLSSINIVEVVVFVEERMDVHVDADDLTFANFDTLGRILRFANELARRDARL